jgi:hypothetical protein
VFASLWLVQLAPRFTSTASEPRCRFPAMPFSYVHGRAVRIQWDAWRVCTFAPFQSRCSDLMRTLNQTPPNLAPAYGRGVYVSLPEVLRWLSRSEPNNVHPTVPQGTLTSFKPLRAFTRCLPSFDERHVRRAFTVTPLSGEHLDSLPQYPVARLFPWLETCYWTGESWSTRTCNDCRSVICYAESIHYPF